MPIVAVLVATDDHFFTSEFTRELISCTISHKYICRQIYVACQKKKGLLKHVRDFMYRKRSAGCRVLWWRQKHRNISL